jgi:hypothetical protein
LFGVDHRFFYKRKEMQKKPKGKTKSPAQPTTKSDQQSGGDSKKSTKK